MSVPIISPYIHDWARDETNRPLRSHTEVAEARALLGALDLPFHPDRPKNWDNLLALLHTVRTTERNAPILDAGACRDSAYLPGLKKLGFTYLTGMNLDETDGVVDGISYRFGDITQTGYSNAHFGFVACLSVIEHGVDYKKFLTEMARVIRPGGHLFISFDYWSQPIEVGDRRAFGAPVKIFHAGDLEDMVLYAGEVGLRPEKPWRPECENKVVNWIGLDYTFYNFLFWRE